MSKKHSEKAIKDSISKKDHLSQNNVLSKETSQKKSADHALNNQHTDTSSIKHAASNRGK